MAQETVDFRVANASLPAEDRRVDRRTFVAWSSVGLLAPWVAPLAAEAAESALAGVVAPTLPLSVGHIEGSDGIRSLRRLNATIRRPGRIDDDSPEADVFRVVPAHELPIGDTGLIGKPLRIRLHGLYPPSVALHKHWRELPRRFELDVLFPSPNPETQPPRRFLAWTFERRSYAWRNSQTVAFNYPIDWQALPAFELRTIGADRVARSFSTRFTLDTESGLPRLQRGLYLLGLQPDAWATSLSLADLGRALPPERHSFLIAVESADRPRS